VGLARLRQLEIPGGGCERSGRFPVAPHVFKYNGAFYLSGNDAPLYKAANILGPYELLGPGSTKRASPGQSRSTAERRPAPSTWMFSSTTTTSRISTFPADRRPASTWRRWTRKDLTHLTAAPKHLFGFDSSHVWERWGEKNEYTGIAWIEGPWMFKRNGTYYIEYSASGTQWLSYASGSIRRRARSGPFTYSPRNPLCARPPELSPAPAMALWFKGPDGNWWVFYTIVMANPPGGRRIGMDPIAFDANGNPYTRGPSETPQWAPGVVTNPVQRRLGLDRGQHQQAARHAFAKRLLQ
jgi:xylan 1,4-beta-xylosidase